MIAELVPIAGTRVATAAQMRAAEAAATEAGVSLAEQMRLAGEGVAAVVHRLGAGAPALILCGPGNNGGDGWTAAAALAERGYPVRVAAIGEPRTDLARAARARWAGPVEKMAGGEQAPVVVDALFGTGLSRPFSDAWSAAYRAVVEAARLGIAVDVPSGVASDDGAALGPTPRFDLTLALGAAKPAHLLQPAASGCGAVRLLPIRGVAADGTVTVLSRPRMGAPGAAANKFTRGMVAVVAGAMKGAALLASEAAMRAGAGYVLLLDDGAGSDRGAPYALVRKPWAAAALDDRRIGAVLIGNGLGRDAAAKAKLDAALAAGRPLVIDGDALHLVSPERLAALHGPVILTPHEGEFQALFGELPGSKIDRARAAARRSGATIVYKGADTVIAHADGERVTLAGEASSWLSTAGSGDVLAGTVAAILAGSQPGDVAEAAVWLHGEAARRCGGAFVADDLARALSAARASL